MYILWIPKYSKFVGYLFAVVAVILATVLREALDPLIGKGVPFILYFPTVALCAWFGDFWPGVLSAALGGGSAWYLFVEPEYSFRAWDPYAGAQLVIFLLSSAFICLLAESLHQATERARKGEIIEREQREQYRVTLASIGDGVIATDARGRVTFMNRVAEALTGWRLDEASGRALEQVFHIVNEETRQTVANPALRSLEEGLIVGLANHTVLIAKDSAEHAIDDSAAPIQVQHGVTGAVLVFRDITQRRAAEREIWESRERLRITLGSIGDGVIATDAEARVTYMNPIAENLLGYRSEQMAGKSLVEVFNIVNELSRETVENPVERVLREGNIVGLANHTILLRPDGVEIPIDDSAAPIRDNQGRLVGVVLVFRDITERRRAERAQATLAAIVESSEDAIYSKDLEDRIMTWNAGAERLLGYSENEAVGRPITLIVPPDRLDEEGAIMARIRRGERLEHYETVRLRKDGTHVDVSLTASPVKSADGRLIGVSKAARDITERKRMERELLEADRQKDNFIAMLAHELRNPLNPIRNAVKILEIERPEDRNLLEYCDLIDKEVMQIKRLLDDLLDVSRITQGKLSLHKERTDLAAAVNNAVETTRRIIDEAGHRLAIRLPSEPLWIEGDPTRLVQVFSNLLINAAKFTESSGDIEIAAERDNGAAIVRVKDSGIGIAPELLPRIFDMFVQGETVTERTHGGLGLGLTLARDIIEFHGGIIEARSEGTGYGSEFIVRLPLAPLSSSAPAADSERELGRLRAESTQRRIVVIDDNKNQALSLQRLLQAMGHEVRVAFDGASAMKLLAGFVPNVALIDLGLPRVNGYELARWLRDQSALRHVTLVAQTGWGREEDRARARESGFDHHLVKPIDYQRLADILNQSKIT